MFSLIITIISIALVAALALATLYYGGDAFNEGRPKAEAAKITNQGQQLLAAADLFYVENGRWPASITELTVDGRYLQSIPQAQAAVAQALAASNWQQPVSERPIFTLSIPDGPTCQEVNFGAYGLDGVLPTLYREFTTQCAGVSGQPYLVVVSKSGAYLDGVSLSLSIEGAGTALPDRLDTAAWTVPPGGKAPVADGTPTTDPDTEPSEPELVAAGALSPSSLDLGRVMVGSQKSLNATLQSVGQGTLQATSASSTNPSFSASIVGCSSVMAGASCDVPVVFSPQLAGTLEATVTIASNDANGPQQLTATGFGYLPAAFYEGGLVSSNATLASSFGASNTSMNADGTAWTVNARPSGLSGIGMGIRTNSLYKGTRQYAEVSSETVSSWIYLIGVQDNAVYGVALDGEGCTKPVGGFNPSCTPYGAWVGTRIGMFADYQSQQIVIYRNGAYVYQAPMTNANQAYRIQIVDRDVPANTATRTYRLFNKPADWLYPPSSATPFSQQ